MPYDCVAVPLPPSFQEEVEDAVERLPTISVVVQCDADTDADSSADAEDSQSEPGFSYVPIDPCQGVIAAIRTALGERIAREFIDMETPRFVAMTGAFPDPYALKHVSPERFAAALLPAIPPPAAPANRPAHRPGWPPGCATLESQYKLILLRLLDPRLALDPRRLPESRRVRRSPSRSSRRSSHLPCRSANAHLRPGRAALYHRPL